jgi:hypothetical protein
MGQTEMSRPFPSLSGRRARPGNPARLPGRGLEAIKPPVVGGDEETIAPGDGSEAHGAFGEERPLLAARLGLERRHAVVERGPEVERLARDDRLITAIELKARVSEGRLERRERTRPEELQRIGERGPVFPLRAASFRHVGQSSPGFS